MGLDALLVLPDHFDVYFVLRAVTSEIQADFQYSLLDVKLSH